MFKLPLLPQTILITLYQGPKINSLHLVHIYNATTFFHAFEKTGSFCPVEFPTFWI